jgi:sugar/nucleoside kinase (ribokinase family)
MSVLCSGSYLVDFIVPKLPRIGEPGSLTYAPEGIHIFPGGHSANVSLCLRKLRVTDIHSVGCTGKDLWHEYIHNELKIKGIKVHTCQLTYSTAKNIALIVEGEDRRFIAELTANSELPLDFLVGVIDAVSPDIFYQGTVGGLTHIDPNLRGLLSKVRSDGGVTFVDVIPPVSGWGHVLNSFEEMEIFHCNLQEARSLSGLTDPKDIAKFIVDKGAGLALISLGRNGAILANHEFTISMPAFDVKEVDPTGAGDAFCSGIISEIMNKEIYGLKAESYLEILLKGQAAGAACITEYGASPGVSKDKVDKLIKSQSKEIIDRTEIEQR